MAKKNSKKDVKTSSEIENKSEVSTCDVDCVDKTTIDGIVGVSTEDVNNLGAISINGLFETAKICANPNVIKIEDMGIFDLIALEKACSLICKRYEMSARIDSENHLKFYEYKNYYDKIFSELEHRVKKSCVS